MKTKDIKQSLYSMVFYLLVMAGVMGCESNEISVTGGQMPETGGLDNTFAILTSVNNAKSKIPLNINKASATDGCCVKLTRPATQTMSFTVMVDESRVESYNKANDTQYSVLPTGYATLTKGGAITLDAGKIHSSEIFVTVDYDELLEPGIYLLPLTVTKNSGEASIAEDRQTIYYFVNVWPEFEKNEYELRSKEYIQIGYLDPEELNPLIVNEIYLEVSDMLSFDTPAWHDILFDIINLQGSTVEYGKDDNIKLRLKEDLSYVLTNKKKYVMPLQAQGHKVCLSVSGGRQGIGFSNLTDDQCSSLVFQIKQIVEIYHLDGVNILDRNNLYNFSSEKLVSKNKLLNFMAALRTALPDKLITFAESEETPSGLEQSVDDIKLGDLVDFAWADEPNKVINPWLENTDYKPIAGLEKKQWGVAVTRLTSNNDELRSIIEGKQMAIDGVNKVFIHYLGKNKAGLETSFSTLWMVGADINWPFDIDKNLWYLILIKCPNDYLDIHSSKWLKDWQT